MVRKVLVPRGFSQIGARDAFKVTTLTKHVMKHPRFLHLLVPDGDLATTMLVSHSDAFYCEVSWVNRQILLIQQTLSPRFLNVRF